MTSPAPLLRVAARGRPFADPACAGCAQLGLFRALRKAGLGTRGGPGCDPDAWPSAEPIPGGRWAAIGGARAVLRGARVVLDAAARDGARVIVVADAMPGSSPGVTAALAAEGARVVEIDPGDLPAAESAARSAAESGATALVALAPCPRGAPRSAPFAIAPSRCNRCGACLALGCPAVSDPGGDAMVIAAACTGCGRCAPLCRARAISR